MDQPPNILTKKLEEAKALLQEVVNEVHRLQQLTGTCNSINNMGETVVIKKNSAHFPTQEAEHAD